MDEVILFLSLFFAVGVVCFGIGYLSGSVPTKRHLDQLLELKEQLAKTEPASSRQVAGKLGRNLLDAMNIFIDSLLDHRDVQIALDRVNARIGDELMVTVYWTVLLNGEPLELSRDSIRWRGHILQHVKFPKAPAAHSETEEPTEPINHLPDAFSKWFDEHEDDLNGLPPNPGE